MKQSNCSSKEVNKLLLFLSVHKYYLANGKWKTEHLSLTSNTLFAILLDVFKLLTQHISGPVTKYKLLYVSNQGRARVRAKD